MLDKYSPLQNRLLRLLSTKAQSKLFTQLKLEKMPSGKVLFETGQVVNHVYFPLDCIVSSLCTLRDGNSAEIYLTGNDGVVGLASIIDSERAICRSVVQSAGAAYQLEMSIIKQAFTQDAEVRTPLLLYALCIFKQMAQTAACIRHHTIDQQLCRWILLSIDLLPDNQLSMTHELIAHMLGVRRERVTEAAGRLHKQGLIEYSRGQIKILDRTGLEQLSCECYLSVKTTTDRLLPNSYA